MSDKKKVKAKTTKTNNTGKMGKTELVKEIADRTSMTQKDVAEVMNTYIEVVHEGLTSGRTVGIQELGSFKVIKTPARAGVKTGTNEAVEIPEGRKVQFRVSSTLKERLSADN